MGEPRSTASRDRAAAFLLAGIVVVLSATTGSCWPRGRQRPAGMPPPQIAALRSACLCLAPVGSSVPVRVIPRGGTAYRSLPAEILALAPSSVIVDDERVVLVWGGGNQETSIHVNSALDSPPVSGDSPANIERLGAYVYRVRYGP